jgi:hypothetical protein
MAKRGRSDEPPSWDEVLTEESMERMALEPTKDAEGKISGYRLVWGRGDRRGRAADVEYTSPFLHVSGGDTHMDGRCYKPLDPDQRFSRWFTIKTTEDFEKAQEWAEHHPDVVEDNARYYPAVQALVQRVMDLTFELPSVRDPLIVAAVKNLRKKEIAGQLGKLKEERKKILLEVVKGKSDLMERAVKEMSLDKGVAGWRDKAAQHIASSDAVRKQQDVAREVNRKMASNYKDKAVAALLEQPGFADAEDLIEEARSKHEEAFACWVFRGKAAEGDAEEMTPDPEPHKTHRAKMRPFFKPRRAGKPEVAAALVPSRATPVEVHPNAIQSSGLDGTSVFRLEDDARQQGYQIRRIDWVGNFSKKADVKMHVLPDGSKIPWFKDPRTHFCRPGSVVRLQISFFVYVKPHVGMRMQFGRYVVLSHRGPKFGRAEPRFEPEEHSDVECDDDDGIVYGDDDGGGDGGSGAPQARPNVILPVRPAKRFRPDAQAAAAAAAATAAADDNDDDSDPLDVMSSDVDDDDN